MFCVINNCLWYIYNNIVNFIGPEGYIHPDKLAQEPADITTQVFSMETNVIEASTAADFYVDHAALQEQTMTHPVDENKNQKIIIISQLQSEASVSQNEAAPGQNEAEIYQKETVSPDNKIPLSDSVNTNSLFGSGTQGSTKDDTVSVANNSASGAEMDEKDLSSAGAQTDPYIAHDEMGKTIVQPFSQNDRLAEPISSEKGEENGNKANSELFSCGLAVNNNRNENDSSNGASQLPENDISMAKDTIQYVPHTIENTVQEETSRLSLSNSVSPFDKSGQIRDNSSMLNSSNMLSSAYVFDSSASMLDSRPANDYVTQNVFLQKQQQHIAAWHVRFDPYLTRISTCRIVYHIIHVSKNYHFNYCKYCYFCLIFFYGW